jgi:glycerate 2-kinase
VPHLVAAPDKFRGTATAPEVAAAVARAAERAGWTADQAPMSDGGEGLLDALGGEARSTSVPGPLGVPTDAEWRLLPGTGGKRPTAVLEMSRASGRALLPDPQGDEPLRADTAGVGHLLLAARTAGVERIVIGCGGSATTDGGLGAVEVVGSAAALAGLDVVVACDVTTTFRKAAALFGPQKGATPPQVEFLTGRLGSLADHYRLDFGVNVDVIPGAGAAGGLAGGLAALGARIVPGFDLVADLIGLPARISGADLVVTGEGHLDPPSFHGKVPGGVLALARARTSDPCPVLCVVGAADQEVLDDPPAGMEIISLTARFGAERSRQETADLVAEVVAEVLARPLPPAKRAP